MQCRDFQREDLDECTQLFMSVYEKEPWNDKWQSFDMARHYLLEFVENPVFLGHVVTENGKIIGASFGHKKTCWQGLEFYIDEFFISFELQRKGVGKLLMNHIKTILAKQNIYTIVLLTEEGYPSEAFYLKEGFRIKDSARFMFFTDSDTDSNAKK